MPDVAPVTRAILPESGPAINPSNEAHRLRFAASASRP
jgi:hypothetical protein